MRFDSNIDVHTKKYYRVVVEGIDPSQANEDSFAIKLSVTTRSTPQRVRSVLHNLPYTIKSGLSAAAANKLKSIVEGIGGIVRIEAHFVTPGNRGHENMGDDRRSGERDVAEPEIEQIFICPECGHLTEEGARFCTVCHRKFRGPNRKEGLYDRVPEKNPLKHEALQSNPELEGPGNDRLTLIEVWRRYKIPIVLVGIGLLLFLLVK